MSPSLPRPRVPLRALPRVVYRTITDSYGRELFIRMVKTHVRSWLASHGLMTVRNVEYIGHFFDEENSRHYFEYPVIAGESYFFFWSLPGVIDEESLLKLKDKNNLYVEWNTQWHTIRKYPMNFAFTKVSQGLGGKVILSTTDLTAPPNAITATVSWVYYPFQDELNQNRILAWRRMWRGRGTIGFLTSPALWRFLTSSGVVAGILALVRWWTSSPAATSAPGG